MRLQACAIKKLAEEEQFKGKPEVDEVITRHLQIEGNMPLQGASWYSNGASWYSSSVNIP